MANKKRTPAASPEKLTAANILREHVIPCFEEHGISRLLFAREKITQAELPRGMRLTRLPPLGQAVRRRGQASNVIVTWPDDEMEALRYPGFFFVYGGEADIPTGNAILHCPAGTGAIIPGGVPRTPAMKPHWLRPHPEKAHSDILWVNITAFGAECHHCHTRGDWHHSNYGWYSIVTSRQIFVLTDQLIHELEQRAPEYERMAASYLNAIFTLILRHLCSAQTPAEEGSARDGAAAGSPRSAFAIEKAKAYIDNHLTHHITLDDIAQSAYVSRAKLAKIFREEQGQTVWEYVTERRLQEAKALLTQTDLFIYRIAILTGFASPTSFIARFTELMGLSPGEYRDKMKAEAEKPATGRDGA